jgi:adenylate kinase
MYVVLLGAPGAGKGTQAPILAEAIGGVHLSSGDMLRAAVRKKSPYGIRAEQFMNEGRLVPDEIVLGMVMERLAQPDAQQAFVLDGFPRNVAQAEELDNALATVAKHLDVAIYIEVPREVLLERLGGRWTCSNCQAIYHELNNPPAEPGRCDRCGGELRQRADDRAEAVERRLQVYLDETVPLVDYYDSRGILRAIDGNQALFQVSDDLRAALVSAHDKPQV